MNELATGAKYSEFDFVAVCIDEHGVRGQRRGERGNQEAVAALCRKWPHLRHLWAPEAAIRALRLLYVPTQMIIMPDGVVLYRWDGTRNSVAPGRNGAKSVKSCLDGLLQDTDSVNAGHSKPSVFDKLGYSHVPAIAMPKEVRGFFD